MNKISLVPNSMDDRKQNSNAPGPSSFPKIQTNDNIHSNNSYDAQKNTVERRNSNDIVPLKRTAQNGPTYRNRIRTHNEFERKPNNFKFNSNEFIPISRFNQPPHRIPGPSISLQNSSRTYTNRRPEMNTNFQPRNPRQCPPVASNFTPNQSQNIRNFHPRNYHFAPTSYRRLPQQSELKSGFHNIASGFVANTNTYQGSNNYNSTKWLDRCVNAVTPEKNAERSAPSSNGNRLRAAQDAPDKDTVVGASSSSNVNESVELNQKEIGECLSIFKEESIVFETPKGHIIPKAHLTLPAEGGAEKDSTVTTFEYVNPMLYAGSYRTIYEPSLARDRQQNTEQNDIGNWPKRWARQVKVNCFLTGNESVDNINSDTEKFHLQTAERKDKDRAPTHTVRRWRFDEYSSNEFGVQDDNRLLFVQGLNLNVSASLLSDQFLAACESVPVSVKIVKHKMLPNSNLASVQFASVNEAARIVRIFKQTRTIMGAPVSIEYDPCCQKLFDRLDELDKEYERIEHENDMKARDSQVEFSLKQDNAQLLSSSGRNLESELNKHLQNQHKDTVSSPNGSVYDKQEHALVAVEACRLHFTEPLDVIKRDVNPRLLLKFFRRWNCIDIELDSIMWNLYFKSAQDRDSALQFFTRKSSHSGGNSIRGHSFTHFPKSPKMYSVSEYTRLCNELEETLSSNKWKKDKVSENGRTVEEKWTEECTKRLQHEVKYLVIDSVLRKVFYPEITRWLELIDPIDNGALENGMDGNDTELLQQLSALPSSSGIEFGDVFESFSVGKPAQRRKNGFEKKSKKRRRMLAEDEHEESVLMDAKASPSLCDDDESESESENESSESDSGDEFDSEVDDESAESGPVLNVNASGAARCEVYQKTIDPRTKIRWLATPVVEKSNVETNDSTMKAARRGIRSSNRTFQREIQTLDVKSSSNYAVSKLKFAKKSLVFQRSPIHGYGLFAMERIEENEFVIEFMGEKIRSVVAQKREKEYAANGAGDSFLFRLNSEFVLDATYMGTMARFVNHSCEPNVKAKIIRVGEDTRICFYSIRRILPGEEILYDYKFERELDSTKRDICLCNAEHCRGFLN